MSMPWMPKVPPPLFSVMGIPVAVSPTVGVLVGLVLMHDGSITEGLLLEGILLSSVLAHELGHALVAQDRGLQPTILLHLLGGACIHRDTADRVAKMRIVAGGPAAGFVLAALGGLIYLVGPLIGLPSQLVGAAWILAMVNLLLAVGNALPIWPMDGGQFVELMLRGKYSAGRAREAAHRVGYATGGLIALVGLVLQQPLIALMFGGLAIFNFMRLSR